MGSVTSKFLGTSNAPNTNTSEQTQNFSYSNNIDTPYQYQSSSSSTGGSLRLTSPKKPNTKVVAIVVTFCEGSSYDSLFTSQEQKSEDGTQTLVYAGN